MVEGISIVIVAFLIIVITTVADYIKDRNFVLLQGIVQEETVPTIRGKFGATSSISIWNLVVGDVIILHTGSKVPADGLVIESSDLEVKEPIRKADEANYTLSDPKKKSAVSIDGGEPFLYADSIISRGTCKVLVCNVGKNSSRGKKAPEMNVNQDTRLQGKLHNLEQHLTLSSIYTAGGIFLLMILMLIIKISMKDSENAAANEAGVMGTLVSDMTKHINLIVVLAVVSIPEGLPLTIGVSLAFSVMKMYNEKLLVRKLDAPEKMGTIEEIVCGKTGTITKNQMKVSSFYMDEKQIKNSRKNTLLNCELTKELLEKVTESILYNCNARIEMDTTTYVPVGNGTEVGLLQFLQDAEIPVHLLIQRKFGRIRAISPHTSDRKRSAVVINCPDRPERVAIYVKGAPEVILGLCSHQITRNGYEELDDDKKKNILDVASNMASRPLRTMAFAFFELDEQQWYDQYESQSPTPEIALEDSLVNGTLTLSFIGTIGLRDPLRQKVKSCVEYAKDKAKMSVRMVSGDHLETAKKVALKAGIL